MLCERCNTDLPDDAVACYHCGTVPGVTFVKPITDSNVPSPVLKTGIGIGTLVIAVLLTGVVAVLVGGILVLALLRSEKTSNETSKTPPVNTSVVEPVATKRLRQSPLPKDELVETAPDIPRPKPQRETIVNEQFVVSAREYKYFSFSVDSPSIISGGFRAYGGANDIDAIIVDEANFTFVANGLKARTYWRTGYAERGKPNVRIPAGTYYLIFDNRKSFMTEKSVAAEIYVEPQ